jgi:hypothetical protein
VTGQWPQPKGADGNAVPDPRLVATTLAEPATLPSGKRVDAGTWLQLTELTRLADARVVAFDSPQPSAFYLLTAKSLRDHGWAKLSASLDSVTSLESGELRVDDQARVLDAFGELASAVLLSLAAIEAAANAAIERLPDEAEIVLERQGSEVRLGRDEMVRRMSLSEKLDHIFPLLTGKLSIKGTVPWQRFVALRRLRDDLVHVKEGGYSNDPDDPSPFGRLFRGDANRCVEDAASIIIAAWPTWLSERARAALGL